MHLIRKLSLIRSLLFSFKMVVYRCVRNRVQTPFGLVTLLVTPHWPSHYIQVALVRGLDAFVINFLSNFIVLI